MNLLDAVKDQFTPELIGKAASLVGESPETTGAALGTLGPALLSAMAGKGDSESGAAELLSALGQAGVGADGPEPAALLDAGADSPVLKTGASLVNALLGDKAAGVFDALAASTGARRASIESLASLAAPLVGGVIAGQAVTAGGAAGLAGLLAGHKDALAGLLPAGLGTLAGAGDGAQPGEAAAPAPAPPSPAAVAGAAGGGLPRWLLPLLGVLALLAIVYFLVLARPGGGPGPVQATPGPGGSRGAVCTAIASANVMQGMPAINANTNINALKTWYAGTQPKFTAIIAATRSAGLPADPIVTTVEAATRTINALNGDLLNNNSIRVNTDINALNSVLSNLRTQANCQ